jgi:Zn-dependent protease/CBS domain-containing protein
VTTSADVPAHRPPARAARRGELGASLRLGTILGVEVGVHASWLVIALLLTTSLAIGYFPSAVPGGGAVQDWVLGSVAAALFFASVLAHELAHSVVARRRGLDVRSITLFIFGGVSNLAGEAKEPGAEFQIAIVGPLTSFVIAALAFGVATAVSGVPAVEATTSYLAFVNAAVGLFNLVPGFPLDGGRVLRSIVWSATNDLRRATEVAATVGQIVAWGLVLYGFWRVLDGDLIGGIWLVAIGWFLQNAAVASLQQTVLESRLRRLRVRDVLLPDPAGVPASTPLPELIESAMLPGARRAVAVVDDSGRLEGLVTLSDVARVPPEERPRRRVAEVMTPRERLASVASTAPLFEAIAALGSGDYEQVPVVDGDRFVGLLTRANVMRTLQIREALHLGDETARGGTVRPGAA